MYIYVHITLIIVSTLCITLLYFEVHVHVGFVKPYT